MIMLTYNFLRLVLLQVGLSVESTNWIMACINSTNFSILINGEPTTFFKSIVGLRQGCSLSPLLLFSLWKGLVD